MQVVENLLVYWVAPIAIVASVLYLASLMYNPVGGHRRSR
jgi:hypothetical protein